MKTLFRARLLLVVSITIILSLVLTVTTPAVVQAADDCYGLNTADCALVAAAFSSQALITASSSHTDFELTVDFERASKTIIDLSVTGNGPFAFDLGRLNVLSLANTSGLLNRLTTQSTMTGTLNLNGKTYSGNLEDRIVSGVWYFNGAATNNQWKSLDFGKIIRQRASGGRGGVGGLFGDLSAYNALRKLPGIPGLIKAERTADTTIDNQIAGTFVYQIDLSKLFASDTFRPLFKLALGQSAAGSKLNDQQIGAISNLLSVALSNTTLSITRIVGVNDKLLHGVGLDVALNIDNPLLGGKTLLNLHFLVKMSALGTPVTVTAPADATPAALDSSLLAATAEPTAQATANATNDMSATLAATATP